MAIDGRLSEAWPNDDSYSSTVLATIGLPTGTSGNTLAQANPTGTVTNERNFSSTFRTDRWGHVTQWTDPLGHTTLTERNSVGLPKPIINVVKETIERAIGKSSPKKIPITATIIEEVLAEVPVNKRKKGPIIEVPDQKTLDELFDLLVPGAKTTDPGKYPGVWKQLPDGTVIGKRPISSDGTPTLDIVLPEKYIKVHIKR